MTETKLTAFEIQAKVDELLKLLAQQQKEERDEAIASVKELIAKSKLTVEEVFGGAKPGPKNSGAKAKAEQKYEDPVTKKTWSGRGLAPVWIKGVSAEGRTAFLIKK